MQLRIADTFTDTLACLAGDEQKAVKTTAFDLQLNPASPHMGFHKVDKAEDKAGIAWSGPVSAFAGLGILAESRLVRGRWRWSRN
jgi:hypothetical protein